MKEQLGIFANDQVNRARTRILASALMAAEEQIRLARIAQGLPAGVPTHMQHDMHRLVGWSYVLGHVIDGAMVRSVGVIEEPETDEEKAELKATVDKYWALHHESDMDERKAELQDLVQPANLTDPKYLRIEAFVVARRGLAAELFPDLFVGESEIVDKDGLTNYRVLSKRLKQLQPGVFQDPERGIVLFAHRFFRRSLSHENKLNDYFLASFDKIAKKFPNLDVRLRLDPDLVGHPATVLNLMEHEYWHGPQFTDDIELIQSGSSVHKAEKRVSEYEGVDQTHFWWKDPETRNEHGQRVTYRTFEVEELIENEAGGLSDVRFGCRYAHAEYSLDKSAITHFDGAIRAYVGDAYLERIEKTIDRAGKHSEYTKLFRFDKALPVEHWKRLLSDYFRGNPLVPEYLGAEKQEGLATDSGADAPDSDGRQHGQLEQATDELSAFISLAAQRLDGDFTLEAARASLPTGRLIDMVETGCGQIDTLFRGRVDLTSCITAGSTDGVLNVARMFFGNAHTSPALMQETVASVADALGQDLEPLGLKAVSVAMSWPWEQMMVTLSLRGVPRLVVDALNQLFSVIDPTKPPSDWIDQLADLIRKLAPRATPVENLWGVTYGVLCYEHSDEVPYRMLLPEALTRDVVSPGAEQDANSAGGAIPDVAP